MRATLGIAGIVLLIGSTANVASSDAPSGAHEFSIAEDAASGSSVGQLRGEADTAEPPAAVTWSIAHDGHAIPFIIDRRSGELRLADQPLDFERQSRHEFTVRTRTPRPLDSPRRAYMADLLESGVDPETIDDLLFEVVDRRVTVNVTDVPEPPVLAPSTLALVIDGDGQAATAAILANDPDSDDAHTFEIIAGDAERFLIDPQTGVLGWRETAAAMSGSFPLTVRVTDSTGLSDAATFNVDVMAPAPAVAANVPDVVLPDGGDNLPPTSAGTAAIAPVTLAEDDPPADDAQSPVAATADPDAAGAELVAPAPPVETGLQSADTEAVAAVPAAVTVETASTGTTSPAGSLSHTAGSIAGFDPTIWLALGVVLAAAGATGAWLRRQRSTREDDAQPAPFRIVREAPATARSLPAIGLPASNTGDELPADRLSQLESAVTEQAAVHQLIASAFQQATGQSLPSVSVPVETEAHLPTAAEFPVPAAVEPFMCSSATAEAPASETPAAESPVYEAPATTALEHENLGQTPGLEPVMPAGISLAGESDGVVSDDDGFGTEPYTSPHAIPDEPAAGISDSALRDELPAHQHDDIPAPPAEPMPTVYGYGVEEEELAGGYYGLRLSQSSEPSMIDEHTSFGDVSGAATDDFRPDPEAENADAEGDDPKLADLRRQLSDLFGVPVDRPRPPLAPVDVADEPDVEAGVETQAADEPAATVDLQAATLELNFAPAFPPAPAPMPVPAPPPTPAPQPIPEPAAASADASAAPSNDPVHSWLEYLKQRALETPGTASKPPSPAIASASSYVAPSPVKPASVPAPAPAVATARPSVPPVRVNKSAVREEISMLRDLANQHSRNVLARRALNQRARIIWLLWGAALIVLCFSGLWSVRHDAGGMRVLGWGLLAGAGIALGCCVYGFHRLTHRPANRTAGEESDGLATVEDLEATAAPELMTPEMEQRLREVLDEARNVPEQVGTRS